MEQKHHTQDSQSSYTLFGVQSCLCPTGKYESWWQDGGTTTCAEDHEVKSRVTASTTQTGHFDGYTLADVGWQFLVCFTTTVLLCFASTLAQKKAGRARSNELDY